MEPMDTVLGRLTKDIERTMKREMKNMVQDAHGAAVWEDVYKAYDPTVYKRRYDLDNPSNMEFTTNGLELTLRNVTPPNEEFGGNTDKELSEVIVSGDGYDYNPHPGPRPFFQGTADLLNEGRKAVKVMAAGLRSKGWDAK